MLEENIVETNFNQFVDIAGKLKNDNVDILIESESARLATSPSNAQKDEFGCYNGGMIQNTLDILDAMRKLDIVGGKTRSGQQKKTCFFRKIPSGI